MYCLVAMVIITFESLNECSLTLPNRNVTSLSVVAAVYYPYWAWRTRGVATSLRHVRVLDGRR